MARGGATGSFPGGECNKTNNGNVRVPFFILQATAGYRWAGLTELLQDCKTARCLGKSLQYLPGASRLQMGWLKRILARLNATPARLQYCKMSREVSAISCRQKHITDRLARYKLELFWAYPIAFKPALLYMFFFKYPEMGVHLFGQFGGQNF